MQLLTYSAIFSTPVFCGFTQLGFLADMTHRSSLGTINAAIKLNFPFPVLSFFHYRQMSPIFQVGWGLKLDSFAVSE